MARARDPRLGLFELALADGGARRPRTLRAHAWPVLAAAADPGGIGALVWTALKVGALSFGGGFVIVPLMQSDAVNAYHWMTHEQFLNAVALGQVTPGPLVQTVAAVGYVAGGLGWALLAAFVAFLPSFCFILLGAGGFERLLADRRAGAFLAGAGTRGGGQDHRLCAAARAGDQPGLAGAAAGRRGRLAAAAALADRADAARLWGVRRAGGGAGRAAGLDD